MTDRPLALGIDLGTSALKVALVTAHGRVLASATAPVATAGTIPGQAEQDCAQWLAALAAAAADLARRLEPGEARWRDCLAAIGLTGQLPTLVVLGTGGPLGPAITWKDSRADASAAALIGTERRALYERTGMPLDGRYLAPMFHCHWRARRDEVQRLLSAKDYLCYALTGACVTDPSTAAGYGVSDLASNRFTAELSARWELPLQLLPAVLPAGSIAGPLNAAGAALLGVPRGVPVAVGAADSVSGAFAITGLEEGRASVAMGSSTIVLDNVRSVRLDARMRYLLTPHVAPGWYAREMDLLATGTGHAWLSALLGFGRGELERRAEHSPPGANGIIFTPYLAGGEQGALWNPALRASVQGLQFATTTDDLARAFMEGVGFEIRRCIEVLAETQAVHEVALAGHLAAVPSGVQMLADILGRPVRPCAADAPAALGAALGALRSLDPEAPGRLSAPEGRLEAVMPGAARTGYDRLFARYLRASA